MANGVRTFLMEFGFSVSGVYQIINVGMTPLQLILVGTALAITVFLCEIPTGIVADVYSRRLSVIIGITLGGIGFIIMGAIPLFAVVLLGNIIFGLSRTFISGAFTAWIVDEIGQVRAEQALIRQTQVHHIARVLGLFVGAFVGSFYVTLPMLICGAGLILLAIVLAFIMPETGFTRVETDTRNPFVSAYTVFKRGSSLIRGQILLVYLLVVFITWGIGAVGFYRLWEKHLLDSFTLPPLPVPHPEIIWFAFLSLLTGILTIALSEVIRTRLTQLHNRGLAILLLMITLIFMLSLIGFGLAPGLIITIGFFLIAFTSGEMVIPILEIWLNRHVDKQVRATVLSMFGQVSAIGEVFGGPAIGWIANASMRVAMILSALLFLPALWVYYWIMTRLAIRQNLDIVTE